MLSAATLVVLAALVLNANRMIIEGERDIVRGEAYDLAVNYAQALLTEIARKKFDANTKDSVYQDPSEFTSPYSLGPNLTEASMVWGTHYSGHDAYEEKILPSTLTAEQRGQCPFPDKAPFKSIAAFDDADDYHGYERVINSDVIQDLRLTVEVYYVTDSKPDNKIYNKTYFKRIIVIASHPTYLRPITFSTLVTN